MDKIFVINSTFLVKQRPTGKVQFLFFRSFMLVFKKFSVLEENWTLGYHSMSSEIFPATREATPGLFHLW